MRDTFTWEVIMKAIARVSIEVPDEFLKSLSQDDLKELILNKSRLNVSQQNRLWTAIGPCDVRINDEVELLVDLNQLAAENRTPLTAAMATWRETRTYSQTPGTKTVEMHGIDDGTSGGGFGFVVSRPSGIKVGMTMVDNTKEGRGRVEIVESIEPSGGGNGEWIDINTVGVGGSGSPGGPGETSDEMLPGYAYIGRGGPGGFGVVTCKIRPAGAQETIPQRLKRYLIEGWRSVWN